jgi:hypothetical protein
MTRVQPVEESANREILTKSTICMVCPATRLRAGVVSSACLIPETRAECPTGERVLLPLVAAPSAWNETRDFDCDPD